MNMRVLCITVRGICTTYMLWYLRLEYSEELAQVRRIHRKVLCTDNEVVMTPAMIVSSK